MTGIEHCTFCDEIGHTRASCFKKAQAESKYGMLSKTSGKFNRKWLTTKKQWRKLNPPNHQGYYECYICGKWVLSSEMELDHIESRTRRPELRYELTNLRPCCHHCNISKGSLNLEEYLEKIN